MPSSLPIELLMNLDGVWQNDKFTSGNIFDYLGKSLNQWLLEALDTLGAKNSSIIKGDVHPGAFMDGVVYVSEGAVVEPTAYIIGPCVIGPAAQIKHGAYIRGNAWIGARAVVGHATEVKGSIFLDDAKAGHFAYVGDSILGRSVNLGAGTKLANLKLKGDEVTVKHPQTGAPIKSGLRKLGAIIGDSAQTGCNAVLSPGSVLMPRTAVLPCAHYVGTLTSGVAK
jgi:UDP-N-acetylglucosamine diphosphorylase / glucose-1-phosphate thymidylyltransferase / UDP-N-acetylgalactosamine diphosphorylase / glucosamine-1-phosphate N-acetyltransferase / galactosamine-1-phosphate N-acetyltransferase